MPVTSTNRERAIPFRGRRHYFHRASPVNAWRTRLSIVALLAATAAVGFHLLRRDRLHADVSHGDVAQAHAIWNSRCDACHIPFGEPGCTADGVLECRDRWHAFRCDGCHAGPANDSKNYAPHYSIGAKEYLNTVTTAIESNSFHIEPQRHVCAL